MIIGISFLLDVILVLCHLMRKRKMQMTIRFLSHTVLIESLAWYMIQGLSGSFGNHVLIEVVSLAVAKIWVVWSFGRTANIKKGQVPIYILILCISLCIHESPILGLVSGIILLVFLLYTESAEETPEITEKTSDGENHIYLKTIEESYRKNRALMHDLKNHMIVIRSLAEQKEYEKLIDYTDAMAEKVSENLFPVRSGNLVLDALLADKYHTARRDGILVEFKKVHYHADLDSQDLCTVIGNLFDNAIAENRKTNCIKERRIEISIQTVEERIIIEMKNPLFHMLKVQNGLPVSDKPDVEHHGIGLRNVRRVCDSYNGSLVFDTTEGAFKITAVLKLTSKS